jgi:hypothetical protein
MPQGVDPRLERARRARRWRSVAVALALPALALAQQPNPEEGVSSAAPAANAPLVGAPAASMPGATLPGMALPFAQPFGGAALGLALPPAEYTRYGASVGVGETDDVNLDSSHPKSQTLAATNLFFDLIRTGSRLQLSALGNFSDIDYLQNAYSNQVLGRFDGFGNLTLWSHHLTWLVKDDYGDQQINPLQSMTPTNLQRINAFATGPDLRLQPTLSSFLDLQALYSRITYQTSPFSGETGTGTATLGRNLSALSSISLVATIQQLRFDNTIVNQNYQRHEYYGQYVVSGARSSINLQAGLAQANDTGRWKSTPLVRVSLTRDASPFSTVTLAGGREYSDAAGGFSSLGGGAAGGITISPAAQTTGNAVHTYVRAGWGFHRLRTTLGLTGGWERNQYDTQSIFDVSRANLELNLGRRLTPRLSANITADVIREQYTNQGYSDDFGTGGAGLTYRPGAWVVLYGRYDHQFRRPAGGAARTFGYDENRVFIMIGYYPHSSGSAAPGGAMGGAGAMPSAVP